MSSDSTPASPEPAKQTASRTTVIRLGSPALLLTLILVLMQVAGVIHWPWWALLGPVWMPVTAVLAFVLVVVMGLGLVLLGVMAVEWWQERKGRS